MKLADIINTIHIKSVSGSLDIEIDDVCFDSRNAKQGSVFCALSGVNSDGNEFIESALDNGASAIISEQPYPASTSATWLHVGNAREAMGLAAANLYDNPSMEMPVLGVTGTNGKTTTALLIHHLLQCNMRRAGMIGTIEYVIGDRTVPAPHTTPESPELQMLLREMRDEDCRGAVMEVSSHGLSQHRTTGVHFDVGVFTNLSQDHLDYHGSMDAYFEAKKLLLMRMEEDPRKKGVMVINKDDKYGDRLLKTSGISKTEMISFGRSASCDFQASDIKSTFDGT
ncbi:MAG: UDP-N-acetylmuramoyl-L-alanyl-D-glutamate--2,6-diaminopimelate ligase, partial [Verrucomicrobiales bacterium]|nr:UDP-N-acetylmuramoyl-L-alanyl-D-glutamate--2,6-diaminopimelate ligase [Verrucomicrobiales bacterium]